MSKSVAFFVLILAIFSGLVASAAMLKYVRTHAQANELSAVPPVPVVVAASEIAAGTMIESQHIQFVQRSSETIPAGAISAASEAVGRTAKVTLYPGEVLMNHRLTPQGGSGGLPTLIPEGYRAITLRVDDTISVAGFVHPGDHVDVLTTVDLPDMDGESATKAILQNVKVIATGQEIERSDENKPKTVSTVTVLTTLEQAERLTLATIAGTIRLVLRNHADHQQSYTPGITLSGLIPQSRRESSQPEPSTGIAVPPPRPVRTVQVYRGGEKSEVTFPR